jgi:predicted PurR-regulated permease PerM
LINHKSFNAPENRQKIILVSLWIAIVLGLILIRSVILPFIIACLLAYVFHPIVRFLGKVSIKSHPMPRWISVGLIYAFFASLIFLFSCFFLPQFYTEMVRLAKDLTNFINAIDDNAIRQFGQAIEEFFRAYNLPVEIVAPAFHGEKLHNIPHRPNWISIDLIQISHELVNDLLFYLKSEIKHILNRASSIFYQITEFIFKLLLILMITGFLLVDLDRIKRFVFSLVPVADQDRFQSFLERLDQRLSGVVRGQLTICLINAILTLIGLLIFHIKFAFILATLAGIFSLVPIFGSIVSTIPIVLVALTSSPLTGLFALIWIIGIHVLEANFLNPKIMGGSANIHPVLILLSLLVGEHYYGIIGALLAVPIMSIIITVFSSVLAYAHSYKKGSFQSQI